MTPHTVKMVHIRLGNLGRERATNQQQQQQQPKCAEAQNNRDIRTICDGDHCNSAWRVYVCTIWVRQHDDDGNTRSGAQLSVSPTFEIRPQHFILFFISRSYFMLPTQQSLAYLWGMDGVARIGCQCYSLSFDHISVWNWKSRQATPAFSGRSHIQGVIPPKYSAQFPNTTFCLAKYRHHCSRANERTKKQKQKYEI